MEADPSGGDPVPPGLVLGPDEALRLLEALADGTLGIPADSLHLISVGIGENPSRYQR